MTETTSDLRQTSCWTAQSTRLSWFCGLHIRQSISLILLCPAFRQTCFHVASIYVFNITPERISAGDVWWTFSSRIQCRAFSSFYQTSVASNISFYSYFHLIISYFILLCYSVVFSDSNRKRLASVSVYFCGRPRFCAIIYSKMANVSDSRAVWSLLAILDS